jgi:hypothetical protein
MYPKKEYAWICACIQLLDIISGKTSVYPYRLHGRIARNIYVKISLHIAEFLNIWKVCTI